MKGNGELLLQLIKGHFKTLKRLGDDLKMTQTSGKFNDFNQLLPNRPRESGSGNTLGALGLIWRLLNGDKLNYLLKVYIFASENP